MQVTNSSGICYECKKQFKQGYEITLNKTFFNKVKLCSCCACSLYSNLAKLFIPKSPKNINERKQKTINPYKNLTTN